MTIGLPATHFSPASITLHLELSIMIGTLAMSGSAAISLRNVSMATLGVEQALVHVDVDDLRAGLDLLARDLDRGRVVAVEDQLLEARRAGDVGPLADVDEGRPALAWSSHETRSFHSRQGAAPASPTAFGAA